jgi:hypothetical protein
MANEDESFIREVNEDLRSDMFKAIWSRFGKLIIAVAVLIVVGTAASVGYDYWRESNASTSGDQFLSALKLVKEDKADDALKALEALEKDGTGAYPVLARMRAATLQAQKGDVAAAIAAFTDIGKDTSVEISLRDTARLRAAWLLVDTGTYEDVASRVQDMAIPASSFRNSAREALGLTAYRTGDFARAKEWFQQIADDPQAPRNVVSRSQMLLDLIASSGKAP